MFWKTEVANARFPTDSSVVYNPMVLLVTDLQADRAFVTETPR